MVRYCAEIVVGFVNLPGSTFKYVTKTLVAYNIYLLNKQLAQKSTTK